jgi:periplasmic divalent cation tolerance protein
MAGHYQVTVTAPSVEEATRLADEAVRERLAACGQVSGPVTSTYWWDGAVQESVEWCCALKTVADRLPALIAMLRAAHSYDVPEIVATPIDAGDPDYLRWIDEETRPIR